MGSSPPPSSAIPNRRLALLFLVNLVAAAGNTALQSILPALGTRLGMADVWVSLAFSWSALLWMLTAPYWARQSDKRGRKALMALGLTGFTASMLLSGLALWAGLSGVIGGVLTFALFALFRSLYGGFGSAAIPAVQAYVAARSDGAERTRLLSIIASSFGLGTVLGPTLAPYFILPVFGLASPMLIFAAIGLSVVLAIRTMLPDDTPQFDVRGQISAYPTTGGAPSLPLPDAEADADADAESDAEASSDSSTDRIHWLDPRVRGWLIAGLVGGHAQAMLLGITGFLVMDRLGLRATPELAAAPTGHVLWVGAMATLLAQWGLIPLLRLSPRAAVISGAIISGIGALMLGWADDLTSISSGVGVAMLGFGLFRPGFTAGASLAVPRRYQGQVAGQTASVNGAVYIIAPAIGVLIYGWWPLLLFIPVAVMLAALALWGWRALAGIPSA